MAVGEEGPDPQPDLGLGHGDGERAELHDAIVLGVIASVGSIIAPSKQPHWSCTGPIRRDPTPGRTRGPDSGDPTPARAVGVP